MREQKAATAYRGDYLRVRQGARGAISDKSKKTAIDAPSYARCNAPEKPPGNAPSNAQRDTQSNARCKGKRNDPSNNPTNGHRNAPSGAQSNTQTTPPRNAPRKTQNNTENNTHENAKGKARNDGAPIDRPPYRLEHRCCTWGQTGGPGYQYRPEAPGQNLRRSVSTMGSPNQDPP